MEIKEAKAKKKELESKLAALLHDFSADTKLYPSEVSFVRRKKYKAGTVLVEDVIYAVDVKVEL